MKSFNQFGIAAALAFALSMAHGATDVRDIAAVIAPRPLIAEYTCTTYVQMIMRPLFVEQWRPKLQRAASKPEMLKSALIHYAGAMRSFCRDIQAAFEGKDALVATAYARQLPGFNEDMSLVLDDRRRMSWVRQSIRFQQETTTLLEIYKAARELAPELLDQPTMAVTSEEFQQIQASSVGMAELFERRQLIALLADRRFLRYAPKEFDLASIRVQEIALRKEAPAGHHGFNDNASDLVRRHFTSGEDENQLGLAAIVARHKHAFAASPPT